MPTINLIVIIFSNNVNKYNLHPLVILVVSYSVFIFYNLLFVHGPLKITFVKGYRA